MLSGEVALVTGAGNGIGRAMCHELAAEGAKLFLVDVDAMRLTAGLSTLRDAGVEADGALLDLSVAGSGVMAVEQALSRFGTIQMLVHAASPPRSELDRWDLVSDETWDAMYRVNVSEGFRMARHLAKDWIAGSKAGRMLFVTSLHAATPRNLPHYASSKAAMMMLVKELARTLAKHGIRVNALTPGAIAAGGFKPSPSLQAKIPMQRLGESAEVAAMGITLLIDRYSRYVTGSEVVVDGGLGLYNWFDPHDVATQA
jgi:3-oxoacyl-[acyl-carrier protein] reductase